MSLKYAILVLLKSEPGSGYDLAQRFKQTLGNFWNASHQQIYQELKKLSDEGLLEFTVEHQPDKPDRKVYSITPPGQRSLQGWMRLPVKPPRVNDALLVKIYGANAQDAESLRAELTQHVIIHRQQLTSYLEMEAMILAADVDSQRQFRLPYMTLRRGILSEQAWLSWAEEMAGVIDEMG